MGASKTGYGVIHSARRKISLTEKQLMAKLGRAYRGRSLESLNCPSGIAAPKRRQANDDPCSRMVLAFQYPLACLSRLIESAGAE
jgi:hypothetical protein